MALKSADMALKSADMYWADNSIKRMQTPNKWQKWPFILNWYKPVLERYYIRFLMKYHQTCLIQKKTLKTNISWEFEVALWVFWHHGKYKLLLTVSEVYLILQKIKFSRNLRNCKSPYSSLLLFAFITLPSKRVL